MAQGEGMMDAEDLNRAFNNAETVMRNAGHCAARAVRFSAGKLRTLAIDGETLRELKRELQHYNAKRGKWVNR